MLINNAGVLAIEQLELTESGLEKQFATNHVGHFALAVGLHGALAAAENGARIVSVSSRGHLASPVVFEDINFEPRVHALRGLRAVEDRQRALRRGRHRPLERGRHRRERPHAWRHRHAAATPTFPRAGSRRGSGRPRRPAIRSR